MIRGLIPESMLKAFVLIVSITWTTVIHLKSERKASVLVKKQYLIVIVITLTYAVKNINLFLENINNCFLCISMNFSAEK